MTQPTLRPRHVRVGTIVWGALVVAIAIFAILILILGPLGPAAILWTIVGFGSILVLGAIAAGIVRAVHQASVRVDADKPLQTEATAVPASTDRLTKDSSDAPLGDD